MSLWSILGLAATLVLFVFVMVKLNQLSHIPKERTQDLFTFKTITPDGIIEMHDGIYRAVLEIEPINMYLRSIDEQKIIWLQFREMLNALHIPITIIIQSRHKDIKPYAETMRIMSQKIPQPQLVEYGKMLADYIEAEVTTNKVKDRRYYIVLEVNPHEQQSELELPSEILEEVAGQFQKRLPPQEAWELAIQELHDAMNIIALYCKQMGLGVYRLNKNAVLEMSYSALNRDLAPVSNYSILPLSKNIHTKSITLEVIKNEAPLEQEEKTVV